ncbi:MerR family transcriptional regulator [Phaeacidiphilus oryzae]|uniref:MerR family transcriptional regulator n=1 Tax=Phaeacidiphilus oryzae TaxID=348818 RepID=UPI00068B51F2|nr:MerR family transcriptional regulator [Phaeacidiphilus oryzae]
MAATDEHPQAHPRSYRVAELAKEAGITVRTLRFYRERGLLPPPRREGRIAWYDDTHLARLRTIATLIERGHTLGGIAELIAAWEDGREVAQLLGVESALAAPWSEETEVRLPADEVAERLGLAVEPEELAEAVDIGYVRVEGDDLVHVSRRLLDATLALVDAGVPLADVLAAGRVVREHADALADLFTMLIRRHLVDAVDAEAAPGSADPEHLGVALERLRPMARTVVDAELAMAMDRRVHAELDSLLSERARKRSS